MFKALILNEENQQTVSAVHHLKENQLPEGEVTVAVTYSSLNYKDGLAITGKGKVVRQFPMIPGIDFSGKVICSQDSRYQTGDKVILTGWGVGENHWGGMAEKARISGEWLVPMPTGFNSRHAMIVGTAGLTAMLCVQALIDNGIKADSGEIVVTGASGGVGTAAISLLSQMGYHVAAVSGRLSENAPLLEALGAKTLIPRQELSTTAKPLEKARFAGAIDTVGSQTLAKVLAQMQYGGVVAACGLAGGMDLPTTVMPFILRGVRLIGIDSVQCPRQARLAAWDNIVKWLPQSYYQQACQEIGLAEVPAAAEKIIKGKITGRVLIKL